MEKDQPHNISDEAARGLHKKKKKKKKHFSSAKTRPDAGPPPQPKIISTDPEVISMLEKIKEMGNDLDDKMGHIFELSGMSKKEGLEFIENPNNFTPEQWQKAQAQKDELIDKFFKPLGMTAKKKFLEKKKKILAKGRRGKTLGSRKGWIQM